MIKFDNVVTKEKVLMVLYNFAEYVSFDAGITKDPNRKQMDEKMAKRLLKKTQKFSSLNGRVVPIDLSSDEGFNEENYDHFYYEGRAKELIEKFIVEKELEPAI